MMLDDMRCFGVLLDSLWASVSGGCKKCQAFGSLGSSRRATMTAPWGEEVGSWMAGRSKVVHFQKCRGCHQKRGFHRVCVWNCVKKVRFFIQPSGWNRGFMGLPSECSICSAAATKEKSSEAKSALRTPSTTRETLRSFAKPWVYQSANPKWIAWTNDNTTLQTLW